MKKTIMITMSVFLVVASLVCLSACDTTTNTIDEAAAYSYVSLKINPEVDYVVDENGFVVSYTCLNEDAEILLADVDLVGMTIEEATATVLRLAVEAGYIDADTEGEEIEVGAIDENGEVDTECYEKVAKNLNEYFMNNGIFGRVSQQTLDLYLEQAEALDLPVGKVKLMILACDRSGLTLDEIKEKPMNEIMKLIHQGNKNKVKAEKGHLIKTGQRKALKDSKCNGNAQKLQAHNQKFEQNKEQVMAQIEAYQENEGN